MIDPELLAMLRCPIDGGPLELADDDLVKALNAQIEAGTLRDRMDQKVDVAIDQGLVTAERTRLYPVRAHVPTLIADEAIALPAHATELATENSTRRETP